MEFKFEAFKIQEIVPKAPRDPKTGAFHLGVTTVVKPQACLQ